MPSHERIFNYKRTVVIVITITSLQLSDQISSAQSNVYALEEAHMCSILRNFTNVAFRTVPMFVWSTRAFSRPFKVMRYANLHIFTFHFLMRLGMHI